MATIKVYACTRVALSDSIRIFTSGACAPAAGRYRHADTNFTLERLYRRSARKSYYYYYFYYGALCFTSASRPSFKFISFFFLFGWTSLFAGHAPSVSMCCLNPVFPWYFAYGMKRPSSPRWSIGGPFQCAEWQTIPKLTQPPFNVF